MIPIFSLTWDARAVFKKRLNRFLAIVDILEPIEESNVSVHIHDPGRLKELLFHGNTLLLRKAEREGRKTQWDALFAESPGGWVLIHSGLHSAIARRMFLDPRVSPFGDIRNLKAEVAFKNSRLDFLVQKNGERIWVEVKGCTLCKDKVALFPDAPTKRGTAHLKHLIEIAEKDRAALIVLIFREDAEVFSPNYETDPVFSKAFEEAINRGVEVYPLKLCYRGKKLMFIKKIPVALRK